MTAAIDSALASFAGPPDPVSNVRSELGEKPKDKKKGQECFVLWDPPAASSAHGEKINYVVTVTTKGVRPGPGSRCGGGAKANVGSGGPVLSNGGTVTRGGH